MSRKTVVLFLSLMTSIIGLTLLREVLKGSPLLILLVSTLISLGASFIAMMVGNARRNRFLVEDEPVLQSKLIDPEKAIKLSKALYKISQKAHIRPPQLSIFSSPQRSAYSYQLMPRKSHIKFSNTLVNQLGDRSLIGILAHETSHIKVRDSWKSVLRFINWVFLLSITFFFIKHSFLVVFPLIIYSELSKMREKEFAADIQASSLTAVDNILHSLLDVYVLQLMQRQILWNQARWYKPHSYFPAWGFEFSLLAFRFFGSHPLWEQRIKNLLNHHNILIKDEEFDFFIKKIVNYRQHYGFKVSINWSKIGLLGQMIPRS